MKTGILNLQGCKLPHERDIKLVKFKNGTEIIINSKYFFYLYNLQQKKTSILWDDKNNEYGHNEHLKTLVNFSSNNSNLLTITYDKGLVKWNFKEMIIEDENFKNVLKKEIYK